MDRDAPPTPPIFIMQDSIVPTGKKSGRQTRANAITSDNAWRKVLRGIQTSRVRIAAVTQNLTLELFPGHDVSTETVLFWRAKGVLDGYCCERPADACRVSSEHLV